LKEEISAEALTRNIEGFSRFLEVAASANGELVNFTSIGNDAAVSPRTVQNYFQVLEDTLTGYLLPPYRKTIKRKAVATAKFYFFDIGIGKSAIESCKCNNFNPDGISGRDRLDNKPVGGRQRANCNRAPMRPGAPH